MVTRKNKRRKTLEELFELLYYKQFVSFKFYYKKATHLTCYRYNLFKATIEVEGRDLRTCVIKAIIKANKEGIY